MSATTLPAVRAPRQSAGVVAKRVIARFPILQVAGVAALFILGSTTIGGYQSPSSIRSMLVLASFLGVAAAGQTIVVLLGGMDLSLPFIIGAANVLVSQLYGGDHWPFWAVAVFITAGSLGAGALSGYIANRFDIHPLIVTLGVGTAIAGGILVWTQGNFTGAAPQWIDSFVSSGRETGPIPLPPVVVFWAGFAVVLTLVLAKTPVGRRLYATGANQPAAKLGLVQTRRVWVGAFAASAFCAALAGVLLAGFSGMGLYNIGQPYLFTSVACVVIGGTSLLGARGDYVRTVLGALVLIQIQTILIGYGFDVAAQQVGLGLVILVMVASYAREPSIRSRI
jgi:ribose transport system permease protein